MNTTAFYSFALHALVISGVGWLLVRWGLRDARHRAWAAMVMALSAVLQPLAVNLGRGPAAAEVSAPEAAEVASAWKPEWTVKLAPARPVLSLSKPVSTEASRFDWRDHLEDGLWVWCVGTLVLGLIHAARSWRAWRWRQGLRRGAREGVWVFDGEGSPCVVGLLRPVIAVPTSVHENWSEDQWCWLLAHEGEHVRERDPLTVWLLGWVRACLWWNPFVHALIGHWSQAREEVCDAVAVSRSGDHERYASFLVDIASQHSSSFAIAMAASRPASRLRARLVAVLEHRPVRERLGWGFRAVMAVIFATGTFLVSCVGVEQPESPPTGSQMTSTRQPDIQLNTKFMKWDDFVPQIRKRIDAGDTLNEGDVESLDQRESTSITTKSGEVIEFIRVPEARHMVTRVLKVAPDFLVRLAGNGHTAQQKLEALGIKFWEGSSAAFNATTSQLVVKHSPATLQKIAALVDQVNQGQTMVFVQSKLIEGPALLGKDGAVIQEAKVQSMMKAIAQQKGVDLLSAPSITTKLGQEATVEVSKERGKSDDFVGIRIGLNPKLGSMGALKLESHVVIAHEFTTDASSLHILSKPADKIDWSKVKRWQHKTTSTLKHGETAVIHVGETQKGRFVTALITAKALLPTGQEAKEFGVPATTVRVGGTLQNKIAALVNGRIITTSEVRDFITVERLWLAHLYRDDPRKADTELKQLEANATELLTQRMSAVASLSRSIKDAELNKLIDQEATAILGSDKQAALAILARHGLTMVKFRLLITNRIIEQALRDKQSGKTNSAAFKVIDWPAKKVFISAKVVDVPDRDLDALEKSVGQMLEATATKSSASPTTQESRFRLHGELVGPDGKPLKEQPAMIALAGVFTDPQFQLIIRALSQMKGVDILVMPSMTVKSGQVASMKAGDVGCEVTPVIGADGYALDLLFKYNGNPVKNAGANDWLDVSTIVTIWDGQTVALGGRISKDGEKPARHRLIFVTANLIEPSGEPK